MPQYYNNQKPINKFNFCRWYQDINLINNGEFAAGSSDAFTGWSLVQPSRTNILLRSQELDNASWGKTSANVTANTTIAPNGTTTADTLTGTGGTTTKFIQQNVSLSSGTYTFSFHPKYLNHRYIQVLVGSTGLANLEYTNIDLLTGTAVDFNGAVSKIYEVENGFYRVGFTFPYVDVNQLIILLVDSLAAARGASTSSTSSLYLWGAQLESGSYMTPYNATTSSSVTTSVGEIIQTATGGIRNSRALKLWVDALIDATYITESLTFATTGKYLFTGWIKGEKVGNIQLKIDGVLKATIPITTEYTFVSKEIDVTAGTHPFQIHYINSENYGFAFIDNVRLVFNQYSTLNNTDLPKSYLMDKDSQSFPILTKSDNLQFYINADTPITGLTFANLSIALYNSENIRVYNWSNSDLNEVTSGAGKHYYSDSLSLSTPLNNLPQGLYYLAIVNTSTGNVIYTSNYFMLMVSDFDEISSVVNFRHYKKIFNYEYDSIESYYNKFRIMLVEKEQVYGGEREVYREITTGTNRILNNTDEKIVKAETYYFDREMHEAADVCFRHETLTINGIAYIAKSAYSPNINQLSRVSKGEIELINQEYSQVNN